MIATSGSTGVPKGVQLSASALTSSAAASLRRIGAGPGERWLCCLPTFHISGIGVLVRSLLTGTEPVVVPSVSPDVLAASGCAHVSLVPTQLRRLVDAGGGPGTVRTVLLGGAAAVGRSAGRGGPRLGLARDHDLRHERDLRRLRLRRAFRSTTCEVRVERRVDGQIDIRGPVLFSGYLGQPDLTQAALAGGWFHTSDLGQWRGDGRLAVRGRSDDVINTGGEKVVPGEVEAVLGTCDGVADVVVIGLPDPEWGEAVTAFVVAANPEDPPGLDQLRSDVRQAISAYAAPKRLVFVSEFPLLPSGKPDKAALRRIGAK